jgi:hypothetical protein
MQRIVQQHSGLLDSFSTGITHHSLQSGCILRREPLGRKEKYAAQAQLKGSVNNLFVAHQKRWFVKKMLLNNRVPKFYIKAIKRPVFCAF